MSDEPEITPEQLAMFRRCTFVRRVFASSPSLRARRPMDAGDLPPGSQKDVEWYVSKRYAGEPFDPEEYELLEGDWDHEHCDVCSARVTDGMAYWPNIDQDAGQVDLCEACYPRVMAELGEAPGSKSGALPLSDA